MRTTWHKKPLLWLSAPGIWLGCSGFPGIPVVKITLRIKIIKVYFLSPKISLSSVTVSAFENPFDTWSYLKTVVSCLPQFSFPKTDNYAPFIFQFSVWASNCPIRLSETSWKCQQMSWKSILPSDLVLFGSQIRQIDFLLVKNCMVFFSEMKENKWARFRTVNSISIDERDYCQSVPINWGLDIDSFTFGTFNNSFHYILARARWQTLWHAFVQLLPYDALCYFGHKGKTYPPEKQKTQIKLTFALKTLRHKMWLS